MLFLHITFRPERCEHGDTAAHPQLVATCRSHLEWRVHLTAGPIWSASAMHLPQKVAAMWLIQVCSRCLAAGTAYLRDSLSAEMAGPAASMRVANPATAAWATRLGFCSCHYRKMRQNGSGSITSQSGCSWACSVHNTCMALKKRCFDTSYVHFEHYASGTARQLRCHGCNGRVIHKRLLTRLYHGTHASLLNLIQDNQHSIHAWLPDHSQA